MKTLFKKNVLSVVVLVVLIAALALTVTSCGNIDNETASSLATPSSTDVSVVGQGETQFEFTVVNLDGAQTVFTVKTDKQTVGEALIDAELIAGENGAYGLYVKTVNGTTLDYDKDGAYWSFYVNGEYAMTGVDSTNIEKDCTYMFKAEKS